MDLPVRTGSPKAVQKVLTIYTVETESEYWWFLGVRASSAHQIFVVELRLEGFVKVVICVVGSCSPGPRGLAVLQCEILRPLVISGLVI